MYANRHEGGTWSTLPSASMVQQQSATLDVLALLEEVKLEEVVSSRDIAGKILRIRTDVAQALDPENGSTKYYRVAHIGHMPRAVVNADDAVEITAYAAQVRDEFLKGGDHGMTIEWIYVGERNPSPGYGKPHYTDPAYLDLRKQIL